MSTESRLTEVLHHSPELFFDRNSKIVMMSDCHRGDGSWADNFGNNQNVYFAALQYYYEEGFTYIELGDGDELWENRAMTTIMKTHDHIFWLLSRFCKEKRLYLLFGNHDVVKKYDKFKSKIEPFCDGFQEGLILRDRESGKSLFLVHGHQGDWLNDSFWRLARFLVRYVWKPLQLIGIYDPTSAAKNYKKKGKTEILISNWVKKNKQPLVAGHTHRPVMPQPGEIPYFNDGSCVHPRCITALEIQTGAISLVKWSVRTRADRSLSVEKDILEGPVPLDAYWAAL